MCFQFSGNPIACSSESEALRFRGFAVFLREGIGRKHRERAQRIDERFVRRNQTKRFSIRYGSGKGFVFFLYGGQPERLRALRVSGAQERAGVSGRVAIPPDCVGQRFKELDGAFVLSGAVAGSRGLQTKRLA